MASDSLISEIKTNVNFRKVRMPLGDRRKTPAYYLPIRDVDAARFHALLSRFNHLRWSIRRNIFFSRHGRERLARSAFIVFRMTRLSPSSSPSALPRMTVNHSAHGAVTGRYIRSPRGGHGSARPRRAAGTSQRLPARSSPAASCPIAICSC